MSIHEKFATVLNRLAITPNIARAQREEVEHREFVAITREIDAGVARAVERLEKRVTDLEKAIA